MTLAAINHIELIDGKSKEEIEDALLKIANQLGAIDDLVKRRTDHEVWKLFQEQQQTMKLKESIIIHSLNDK